MPKNINQIKKLGQILILQQILKLKNIKLLPKNLKFVFLNLLLQFHSNSEV